MGAITDDTKKAREVVPSINRNDSGNNADLTDLFLTDYLGAGVQAAIIFHFV